MKRSVEEKYEFLLSILEVNNVDFWESDGMINLPKPIYFQFPSNVTGYMTVDEAVEYAMGNNFNVQAETDPAKSTD